MGPQESLTGIEKLVLSWVPMNIQNDWKAKLESTYSFMLKYSKIAMCERILNDLYLNFESDNLERSQKQDVASTYMQIKVLNCNANAIKGRSPE